MPKPWTPEEDDLLRESVSQHGARRWGTVASAVPQRSATGCCARWNELQSRWCPLVRQSWTEQEDRRIRALVQQHGPRRWAIVASFLPGRSGKQCRERWHNQLDPGIKRSAWTAEEDALLVRLHRRLGNAWSRIAERLPGRTDNAVKNRWHSARLKARACQTYVYGNWKRCDAMEKSRQPGCEVLSAVSPTSPGNMSIGEHVSCLDKESNDSGTEGEEIEMQVEMAAQVLSPDLGLELELDWDLDLVRNFTHWDGTWNAKESVGPVGGAGGASVTVERLQLESSEAYWGQICVAQQEHAILELLEPLDFDGAGL